MKVISESITPTRAVTVNLNRVSMELEAARRRPSGSVCLPMTSCPAELVPFAIVGAFRTCLRSVR